MGIRIIYRGYNNPCVMRTNMWMCFIHGTLQYMPGWFQGGQEDALSPDLSLEVGQDHTVPG